jgi:hypothetical protein
VSEGHEEGNIAIRLHSYDSLRVSGSQALGESGTAPFLAGPALRCSQTCPNNFPAQVCNVRNIATTMWMLERWGWSRRSGKSRERLSGGPVSSCRRRFSTNSFMVSFGGKRSVKGNEENRSWHREKPMLFHRGSPHPPLRQGMRSRIDAKNYLRPIRFDDSWSGLTGCEKSRLRVQECPSAAKAGLIFRYLRTG